MSHARPDSAPRAREPGKGPPIPHLKRRLAILALGPLVLGVFQLTTLAPWTAEEVYASWLGPALVRALTLISGLTSVSLVEPTVLGVLAWVGWCLFRELRRARNRGRGRPAAVASWLLSAGETASVLTALFYLLWGFNYARPPLEARLGWEEVRQVEADELAHLAGQAIQATNYAYRSLHGSDDAGAPTRMPEDREPLDQALVHGWAATAEHLELAPVLGRDRGPVKTLLSGGLLSELGLLGFYFPFTAEPVVNGRAPAVILPRSMAHEQAHQRGVAAEDEANFMAVMATIRAPDPLARYAGYAAVQRRLLNDLAALDRDRAVELVRRRLPGVERDARALDEFYRSLEGPVNEVAERVNDAYLRHHRVEGGIRSYGLVTRLLVAWARREGGIWSTPPSP